MPHRRSKCLIGDQHTWSETNMLIEDRHAFKGSLIRLASLQSGRVVPDGSPMGLWLSMPDQRPIRDQHACSDGSPMRHVGLWWGMLVSDQKCQSPLGLRWVFDRSPIKIIFIWTPKKRFFFVCLPLSSPKDWTKPI